jgi:ferric-dicitrate binding protein FerR (iron transport regulator)
MTMARSTLANRTATTEHGVRRRFPARRVAVVLTILAAIAVLVVVGVVSSGAKPTLAQLRVRAGEVDVEQGAKGFVASNDGTDIAAPDIVRTSSSGQAVVGFLDGSVTRLDSNTRITVTRLKRTKAGDQIGIALASGRIWDHVREAASPGDSFDVRLASATLSSNGSTFLTDCRRPDACYVVDFDGTTHIASTNGNQVDLEIGQCESVAPDGSLATCNASTLGLVDTWVRSNLAEDQELPTPSATPSPSPSAPPATSSSSGGGGFIPRPVTRPVATPAKTAAPSTPVATPDHNHDGKFPTEPPEPTPRRRVHPNP